MDALTSLRRLREGKFTEEQIQLELDEIIVGIHNEQGKGKFTDLFRGTNSRRLYITVWMNILLVCTGLIFLKLYGPLFVKGLKVINQFTYSCIGATFSIIGAMISMVLIDKIGRRLVPITLRNSTFLLADDIDRKLAMFSASIQALAMFLLGGLSFVKDPSYGVKVGMLVAIMIFGTALDLGWSPVVHTLNAEIPSSQLRDLTYRTANTFQLALQ